LYAWAMSVLSFKHSGNTWSEYELYMSTNLVISVVLFCLNKFTITDLLIFLFSRYKEYFFSAKSISLNVSLIFFWFPVFAFVGTITTSLAIIVARLILETSGRVSNTIASYSSFKLSIYCLTRRAMFLFPISLSIPPAPILHEMIDKFSLIGIISSEASTSFLITFFYVGSSSL